MSLRYYRFVTKFLASRRIIALRNKQTSGFTLTELLVSLIMGSLVVTGLLGLTIELLTTDARETARTETQREMQMALEYISTDLREAVYVYDGACLAGVDASNGNGEKVAEGSKCGGLVDKLRGTPDGGTPIVGFWKLDPLPDAVGCGNGGNGTVPCLAGRSYTLVVYYLVINEADGPWKGLARIVRYELPTYNSRGALVNDINPDNPEIGFIKWPGTDSPPAGNSATLVDFVDSRSLELLEDEVGAGASVECPDLYVLTPDKSTLTGEYENVRNFYACVKVDESLLPSNDDDDSSKSAFNQKVILFIRGNAKGKPGIDTANEGFMPAIATQVLNRGVKNKKPR